MKRILILTVAVGAVAAAGIGIGVHSAESGHRGDGFRGSHSGGGWGRHGGGHGWGHRRHRARHGRMRRMMKRFDANNDKKLTQEEITEGRRALITKHDTDGNGQLSLAEFEKLWLENRRRRMVRAFQRWDEDGDASVTTDEFLAPFADIVERMDRNDDGFLDKSDRRRKYGRRHHRRHGKKHENKPADDAAE